MMLSGKQVYLRALESADLDELFQIENDVRVWELSHTLAPYSKDILLRYIESAEDLYTGKQLRLVVASKEDQRFIGLLDVFDYDPFHKRAGIGIIIKAEERNRGYAKESISLLLDYLRDHLELHQVYCNITSDNELSIQLFESLKFKSCGVKKEWIRVGSEWKDEMFFQLLF